MKIEETPLDGCFMLRPRIFEDERGSFFESYNKQSFDQLTGLQVEFVQDNQSVSKKGVLRGLHFQTGEYSQAKLVRVIKGEVLDVAVDLRPNSKTYKQHFSIILNDENNVQFFIPRGFAHGFITLSDLAVFAYKCDNYYNKESELGIIYNDPDLAIDWSANDIEILLSEKDKELPLLKDLENAGKL
ncbi:dTDP-4-dehydrorhamnose 3,5-epimerase [Aquimarina sp. D1M17]|uniref:dTDP-4-dehydrorhamnose 3,5-epimerase n=1 Tax=Aquimarina acroporae TaxID=2937283 RepID=UPI0020C02B85|nr:dTDP-4-dehydrorhamnose 3,5-epimerase [Aquimarina acroporae]MCK8523339.1 dTDP-4-dehydrorhamnose 3,5-epimerase [Aquimarina acroporae]